MTWLSIVVPTIGRPTLARMVASVPDPTVEIVVVADTYQNDVRAELKAARRLVNDRVVWLNHDAGYHCWGHPQRQKGMSEATGRWLMFSQDDNVLVPGALDAIRMVIARLDEPRPLLFQVDNWSAGVVWKQPVLVERNVDADCIVVPSEPTRLGTWGERFQGDYDFIVDTCRKWPLMSFCRAIIARSPERDPETRRAMQAAWTL